MFHNKYLYDEKQITYQLYICLFHVEPGSLCPTVLKELDSGSHFVFECFVNILLFQSSRRCEISSLQWRCPEGTKGDLSPISQQSAKLSKNNGVKSVGYTLNQKNCVKTPPPLLSIFSELAPPLQVYVNNYT